MATRIIDVTIRDGGYKNGHAFDKEAAAFLVGRAAAAGVDYVEVGYRKGPLKVTPGLGVCGLSPDEYLQSLRISHPAAKLAVMAHPRHIQDEDIGRLAELGISLLRLCVDMSDLPRSEALFHRAKDAGLAVSVNFTRITARPIDVTLSAMRLFAAADVIYIADSNGSMTPHEVTEVTNRLKRELSTPLGFHAHNNLSLALANTIAAIDAGMTWVDASLRGMGRGAGNLATEIFVAFLERTGGAQRLDAAQIIELADDWERLWMPGPMHLTPLEVTLAAYNFPGDFAPSLLAVAQQLQVHWSVAASRLNELGLSLNSGIGSSPRKNNLALIAAKGH